ncbi:hypothetical protein PV05_07036 [Exophiala xenobiotica]|uniref:Amino acid permease/ SLC12A domain-containing protein n=1 Tax=Exophiala xenobiotica TaxID=348802 RepID=A0A0D2EJ40_9EURO|nr:uncharacterized protein PV05_07036 [Exophiala xenobiotica]KIW54690.1 hypothetical protein PV05_07036 [Exophiala xenobiotica]
MRNPRKNLPSTARRFFIRLVVFYVLGALAIGIITNSDSDGLVSGTGNANASPWVIAIHYQRRHPHQCVVLRQFLPLHVEPSVVLPRGCRERAKGIHQMYPLRKAYLRGGGQQLLYLPCLPKLRLSCWSSVFNWLINLTNTAGFTSWVVCSIVLIRFRKACVAQGITVPYSSRIQPYAS